MDPQERLRRLDAISSSQAYQRSYDSRMRQLGRRGQHFTIFPESSNDGAATTYSVSNSASLFEEQKRPIFARWQIICLAFAACFIILGAGGPWNVIVAIWNWIKSCWTWICDRSNYLSNRLLQLRLWIGQVLEPYLEPTYASPWANMAVNILLWFLRPIRTYRSAKDWMGQKYNNVRYSQRFTIFTHRVNAVTNTLHGLLWGWWQAENGFPWVLVAPCVAFCAILFAKGEYNKYVERQRVIPWYDNRVIRTNAPAPMFFDRDPRVTAIGQDPTWNAVDDTSTAKSFVNSLTSERPARHARQDKTAKSFVDTFTPEDAARGAEQDDSSLAYLTTTDESSFRYSEMSRPGGQSARFVSETSTQPKPKIPSQPPVTPRRVTSKKDRLAEERSEREWRNSKLKQATTGGKWEPWKEDMAKDPNKRRWVGQGLTWCLSCKQYHCCELPY